MLGFALKNETGFNVTLRVSTGILDYNVRRGSTKNDLSDKSTHTGQSSGLGICVVPILK